MVADIDATNTAAATAQEQAIDQANTQGVSNAPVDAAPDSPPNDSADPVQTSDDVEKTLTGNVQRGPSNGGPPPERSIPTMGRIVRYNHGTGVSCPAIVTGERVDGTLDLTIFPRGVLPEVRSSVAEIDPVTSIERWFWPLY